MNVTFTAEQINVLISWRIGRKLELYDGPTLDEENASREIERLVSEFDKEGDTVVLPISPLRFHWDGKTVN